MSEQLPYLPQRGSGGEPARYISLDEYRAARERRRRHYRAWGFVSLGAAALWLGLHLWCHPSTGGEARVTETSVGPTGPGGGP